MAAKQGEIIPLHQASDTVSHTMPARHAGQTPYADVRDAGRPRPIPPRASAPADRRERPSVPAAAASYT